MFKIFKEEGLHSQQSGRRKGAILVLSVFFIAGILTFVGMSVDLGLINVTKSRMQSSADGAALAAAQEITVAIREAADSGNASNVHEYARTRATAMAKEVASRNGFFLEDSDVEFGRRSWNPDTAKFEIDWSGSPHNAVRVNIRKDGADENRGDSKLQLMFAPVFGDKTVALKSTAAAFVEARDFVTVCDYSGSMNYDSLPYFTALDKGSVQDDLDEAWDTLVDSNAYFSNAPGTRKFPASGWGKINSYAGTYVVSSSADAIYDFLELESEDQDGGVRFYDFDNYIGYKGKLGVGVHDLRFYSGFNQDINSFRVDPGYRITLWDLPNYSGWKVGPRTSDLASLGIYNNDASWIVIEKVDSADSSYEPYPQEGRNSNGSFKGMPSQSVSKQQWKDYISWVISNSNDGYSSRLRINSTYDYRYDFGYRTLMMYLLHQKRSNAVSEDLFRVAAYPFQAVKDGMTQFNSFLTDLQFGDSLGLVGYGATAEKLNSISSSEVSAPNSISNVDLGSKFLTTDYSQIETIQLHHQAAHYSASTNIGDGVKAAREILTGEGRAGARWQMLVMTDGQVNRPSSIPSGLPADWDSIQFDEWFDWDGDGFADYTASDLNSGDSAQKRYLIYEAREAVRAGITIHSMAVGHHADRALMKALANMGGGVYIEVAAETTTDEISALLEEKFNQLAGNVPAAKLSFD